MVWSSTAPHYSGDVEPAGLVKVMSMEADTLVHRSHNLIKPSAE